MPVASPVQLCALVLGLSITAGCGSSGSGVRGVPSMTGGWSGKPSAGGFPAAIDFTLEESADGSISGAGTLNLGPLGAAMGTVTGTHVQPNVALNASAMGFPSVTFTGTFLGPDTVAGTVTVEGSAGVALTIQRQ